MASRVFALIVGIDQYKSSHIWNLSSCVDDALSVKQWLSGDLRVPRDNIRLLLDSKATRSAIEDAFMTHLISNPAIEPGDAIIFYFAGHGSSVAAPVDWRHRRPRRVDMLCPYDHCSRSAKGRVAGITDWSMHAMLAELAETKGDNITVILDCCFSPSRSGLTDRLRRHTRWTPSPKLTEDDLYIGLWRNALSRSAPHSTGHGFHVPAEPCVTMLACGPGERAIEEKEGGRFTCAILDAQRRFPLHQISYEKFLHHIELPNGQAAICVGSHAKRIIFNGIPFTSDAQYVSASLSKGDIRVDAGVIHGVVEGSEFSLHSHNSRGSINPTLASLRVFEVHPTWSLARPKQPQDMPKIMDISQAGIWARITHWNNHVPFRVYLEQTYFSLIKWWQLRKRLPPKSHKGTIAGGVTVIRVSSPEEAELSIRRRCREITLGRYDALIARNCPPVVSMPCEDVDDDIEAINAAARFHLHLHRKNSMPSVPLRVQVSMALHRIDEATWTTAGPDMLENGKAKLTLHREKGSVYALLLDNKSNHDLWPYLFWMDAYGYVISTLYHPSPALASPPLKRRSTFTIGADGAGSEAISFRLFGDGSPSSGFLKLFLSSAYVPMGLVEQGKQDGGGSFSPDTTGLPNTAREELWDSKIACISILQSSST